MALFLPGQIISDIRGKLGGSVFQKSAAGLTIRNKTSAVNRSTISQSVTRSIIKQVQNSWQTLTDDERNTWNSYQDFQGLKQKNIIGNKITGHQLFLKVNTKFLQYGQAVLTVPTFTKSPLTDADWFINIVGVELRLNCTRVMVPGDEFFYLQISSPLNNSVSASSQKKRLLIRATPANTRAVLNTEYIAMYGKLPIPGEKIFWRASLISLVNGLEYSVREFQQSTY